MVARSAKNYSTLLQVLQHAMDLSVVTGQPSTIIVPASTPWRLIVGTLDAISPEWDSAREDDLPGDCKTIAAWQLTDEDEEGWRLYITFFAG